MLQWLFSNDVLTADLGRSLLTALCGAGLGAWAAQSLAARIREREERPKTVRAANSATMLAYTITESLLNFKHQIVKPTYDRFMAERQRILDERKSALKRPPGAFQGRVTIYANAELHTFQKLTTPIKDLQDLVFKQLSPPTRPFWVMGKLSSTLEAINQLIDDRNAILEEFRKAAGDGKETGDAFYGLPVPGGADQRHMHHVEHISASTDDAIAFSKLIGDDLLRYTKALHRTLPETLRPMVPVIVSANFSKRDDVMPDPTKYADYEQMYQEVAAFGSGVWLGRFEHLASTQYRTFSVLAVM